MIRFAKILRSIKSYLVEISSIGGNTQNRFISPKGLYSRPIKENAIVINLANGTNQDVVLCLQKDIELQDGDVYLTDDRNFIHFKFDKGIIQIKGDSVFDDNVEILKDLTVKGKIVCDTSIEAGTTITAGTVVTAQTIVGSIGVSSGGIPFNTHGHAYTWTDPAGNSVTDEPESI